MGSHSIDVLNLSDPSGRMVERFALRPCQVQGIRQQNHRLLARDVLVSSLNLADGTVAQAGPLRQFLLGESQRSSIAPDHASKGSWLVHSHQSGRLLDSLPVPRRIGLTA
jgi:hypothetical protein